MSSRTTDLGIYTLALVLGALFYVQSKNGWKAALLAAAIYITVATLYELLAYALRWQHLPTYGMLESAVVLLSSW